MPDLLPRRVRVGYGPLAAVGRAGGGHDAGLPDSRAGTNALPDRAATAHRESLLVAFLDRLTSPVRPAAPGT